MYISTHSPYGKNVCKDWCTQGLCVLSEHIPTIPYQLNIWTQLEGILPLGPDTYTFSKYLQSHWGSHATYGELSELKDN